jgi:hypothetical protein
MMILPVAEAKRLGPDFRTQGLAQRLPLRSMMKRADADIAAVVSVDCQAVTTLLQKVNA